MLGSSRGDYPSCEVFSGFAQSPMRYGHHRKTLVEPKDNPKNENSECSGADGDSCV